MVVRQDEYIEHWGIRGMKWGHRRFQEYGGSARTTAGKIRYDEMPKGEKGSERAQKTARVRPSGSYANAKTSNKVSNSDKATKSLNKKSNSEEDNSTKISSSKSSNTNKSSRKRMNLGTASKVATVAGLGVLAGVGAYVGYKAISKNYVDKVLKAGLEMQTITTAKNLDLGKRFYASFEKSDMRRYKYLYGKTLSDRTRLRAAWKGVPPETIKSVKTQLTKSIKVPSHYNAGKIFEKLYAEDADFSKVVDKLNEKYRGKFAQDTVQGKIFAKTMNGMSAKVARKNGYEAFNFAMVANDEKMGFNGIVDAQRKFFDALKDAGYNALQDVNDQKYSGYRSKNPLIVFDTSSIVQKAVSELDMNDINANWMNVYGEVMNEASMQKVLDGFLYSSAIGGASTAAVGMTGRNIDKRLQNRNTNRR